MFPVTYEEKLLQSYVAANQLPVPAAFLRHTIYALLQKGDGGGPPASTAAFEPLLYTQHELDEAAQSAARLRAVIQAQGRMIEERWVAMQEMDAMIRQRDQAIAAQTRMIDERWEAMQKMEAMIRQRDKRIRDLEALLHPAVGST